MDRSDRTEEVMRSLRQKAQLALAHAKEQSALAQELEQALQFAEELVAIVSHDLRSPISAILTGAELLTSTESADTPAHQIALRILSAGDRARRMVDTLLDYSQARAGGGISISTSPCDIHRVAKEVVEELALANPDRKIRLKTEGDGLLDGDALRIGQIVSNLLSNAVAHGENGGVITVSTQGLPNQVAVRVHNENSNGPIPSELRPLLFLPFRRGPSNGALQSGIGLGLYIVDQLVRAHRGKLDVHSTSEEGTSFMVTLPRGLPPTTVV